MIRQVVRAFALGITAGLCFFMDGSQDTTMKMTKFIQRFTFSSWFGTSVWVSFVAGIVMFKNMRRHDFGALQAKLFPVYFEYSVLMLSITCGATYSLRKKIFDKEIAPLAASLALNLINLFYLEPKTTKIMFKRHALERELGAGHEIGSLKPESAKARADPRLKEISKQFGKLHGLSTTVNLIALCCGTYHVYTQIE